jgi:hypothetical protein
MAESRLELQRRHLILLIIYVRFWQQLRVHLKCPRSEYVSLHQLASCLPCLYVLRCETVQ